MTSDEKRFLLDKWDELFRDKPEGTIIIFARQQGGPDGPYVTEPWFEKAVAEHKASIAE